MLLPGGVSPGCLHIYPWAQDKHSHRYRVTSKAHMCPTFEAQCAPQIISTSFQSTFLVVEKPTQQAFNIARPITEANCKWGLSAVNFLQCMLLRCNHKNMCMSLVFATMCISASECGSSLTLKTQFKLKDDTYLYPVLGAWQLRNIHSSVSTCIVVPCQAKT